MTATDTVQRTTDNCTPPSPQQIDALILEFSEAQSVVKGYSDGLKVANEDAGEIKARLTAMVEAHGFRHTEKSKRLAGLHNTATTTTATRVAIDAGAVDTFRAYLDGAEIPGLAGQFFCTHTSYSLVTAPGDVLKTLTLGTRIRTKITSLLGLCFRITANAPSLKVDVVVPAKPERAAA